MLLLVVIALMGSACLRDDPSPVPTAAPSAESHASATWQAVMAEAEALLTQEQRTGFLYTALAKQTAGVPIDASTVLTMELTLQFVDSQAGLTDPPPSEVPIYSLRTTFPSEQPLTLLDRGLRIEPFSAAEQQRWQAAAAQVRLSPAEAELIARPHGLAFLGDAWPEGEVYVSLHLADEVSPGIESQAVWLVGYGQPDVIERATVMIDAASGAVLRTS